MRIFLQVVLPFLAPFLAYGAYRVLVTRGRGILDRTTVYVLTVCGLVLACAGLVSLAFVGGAPPSGKYIPPHIEGGRVVPGQVVPK